MLLRAITAFVAIPGLVAFAIPITTGIVTGRPTQHEAPALALILLGTVVLVWCVREFYVAGRGTLAPWARPQRLVTSGPYRFSRNPMYVCTIIILLGWCVLWDSPGIHIHTAVTLCVVIARVCFLEEVWVQRHFGSEWDSYRARTPRWLLPIRRTRAAGKDSVGPEEAHSARCELTPPPAGVGVRHGAIAPAEAGLSRRA
jgi:protein-S-isoprenylcysteine O-methyltransferase Ste14